MSYLGLYTVKPDKPIKRKDTYIFNKTTADQIVTDEEKDTRLPAVLDEMKKAAMPKAGGDFLGNVTAATTAGNLSGIRNMTFFDKAGTAIADSVSVIKCYDK